VIRSLFQFLREQIQIAYRFSLLSFQDVLFQEKKISKSFLKKKFNSTASKLSIHFQYRREHVLNAHKVHWTIHSNIFQYYCESF
jgi:hypothetical protein